MLETLDTTLRDGAQAPGIAFSLQDKLAIVRTLDELGMGIIEAGNPGSNPKDAAFYEQVRTVPLRHSRLAAFGMTCRAGVAAAQDAGLTALLQAQTPVVCVVGKASAFQVQEVLQVPLEENLRMIRDSLRRLSEAGREVIFDAEHFFDAWQDEPEYALACLRAAREGGADCLALCDTNGGNLPEDIAAAVKAVHAAVDCPIGIHTHNDCGLALAGALAAIQAGAEQVQGTLLGFGERCGNCDLATLAGIVQFNWGQPILAPGAMERLTPLCRRVAEIANIPLPDNHPLVGASAFAHKGGMHIDGVMKLPETFEYIDPEWVGNTRHFLVSEVAGRGVMAQRVRHLLPGADKHSPEVVALTQRVKELEGQGYQFEGAQASLELIIRKELGLYQPFFKLKEFKIVADRTLEAGAQTAHAVSVIKVEVDGKQSLSAGEGVGPVHAMDAALRQALQGFYPELVKAHLTDFKVRVIDGSVGTAALVRVLIQSTDGEEVWNTVGVSSDIIEASYLALVDSIEYKLMKDEAEV
jgi:2-isopropylmalate synthase